MILQNILKEKWIELKGKIDESTFITRDFASFFLIIIWRRVCQAEEKVYATVLGPGRVCKCAWSRVS